MINLNLNVGKYTSPMDGRISKGFQHVWTQSAPERSHAHLKKVTVVTCQFGPKPIGFQHGVLHGAPKNGRK